MGTTLKRGGLFVAVIAIALIGASSATAADGVGKGGWLTVTVCHKPKHDGGKTMNVNIVALIAHLLHGDSLGVCVTPPAEEEGGEEEEQPTCEQQGTCEQPEETCEQQGTCEQPEETCEQQETCEQPEEPCEQQETCEQPEEPCEQKETCEHPEEDPTPTQQVVVPASPAEPPAESRSLFCSTTGPVDRGNGEHPGVALDLTEEEGAPLVENGLATPAIFYAGLGVTCDVLPGFVYAGYWVDHVGDVVPGVAVYPYYVPTAG